MTPDGKAPASFFAESIGWQSVVQIQNRTAVEE